MFHYIIVIQKTTRTLLYPTTSPDHLLSAHLQNPAELLRCNEHVC